eukprot:9491248-Pyramimonas_sp.AAC.1
MCMRSSAPVQSYLSLPTTCPHPEVGMSGGACMRRFTKNSRLGLFLTTFFRGRVQRNVGAKNSPAISSDLAPKTLPLLRPWSASR